MAKKKYQVNQGEKIIIMIFLMRGSQSIAYKSDEYSIHTDVIDYKSLKDLCLQFMKAHGLDQEEINIYIPDPEHLDNYIALFPNTQITLQQIFLKMNGTLMLIIKGVIDEIKSNFELKIAQLMNQIEHLKKEIQQIKKPINLQLYRKNSFPPMPLLMHGQSKIQRPLQNIQLDIAILFSEPLYDQYKNKYAPPAVDFRSQITRLNIALKSSYRRTITMRCQIATFQSLKNMIKYSKPKIMHIICHGNSQGSLQFEDDSRNTLGLLQLLKPGDIKNLLKNQKQLLPSLVFINSCHSQQVGRSFYQLGVNNVIMINSQDPISDQAAQLFSEHFYRNIFRGGKVMQCFTNSKQKVQIGHTSTSCCCSHSALESHRQNCRTLKELRKNPIQYHKDYHVPSSKCQCQMRNFNRHNARCQWAQKVLLQINEDFRIPIQGSPNKYRFPLLAKEFPEYCFVTGHQKIQLNICCCQVKGRKPHSESNKFKILTQDEGKSVLMPVLHDRQQPQITDLTSTELLEAHQKSKAIFGRQKELFQFLKQIKDVTLMYVYGKSGVGITTFTVKASTYMMQRRLFQFFFFIDLYDIKDQTVFRYKFNQITNFQYNGKQINQFGVKNRKILILFDNCDQFIDKSGQKFYSQIETLIRQIPKCKIIITFKQQTKQCYDEKKILTPQKCYELLPFQFKYAHFFLNTKLKDKTDISVGSQQLKKLVSKYQILRIPKVIESLSQSFPITQKRVKLEQIQKNVEGIKVSDTNKLTQNVLNQLQKKSQEAYQFLIFTSLFSDGVTFQDLNMFSTYFKKDMSILLPVKKNWQEQYLFLFEKQKSYSQLKNQKSSSLSPSLKLEQVQSSTENLINKDQTTKINMKKRESQVGTISSQNGKSQLDYLDKIEEQSYFVDKSTHGKFTVKRFIRDFIWKKHQNQTTNQIKFLFVAYFSVILQILFQTLKQTYFIHEDVTTYSAISSSGIFSFNTSLQAAYEKKNLTKSVKFAKQFISDLDLIFGKNQQLLEKMKKTDHSTFIMNHRQDFLKIYDTKWIDVFNHLKKRNKDEEKVFVILLENLMINIPTAFKIANAQTSLIKYVIRGSQNELKKMSQVSPPQRSLKLKLKLLFIQIGISLQNQLQLKHLLSNGQKLIQQFNVKLSAKRVESLQFRDIRAVFDQQKFIIDLIMDQKSLKMQSSNDVAHLVNKKFDFTEISRNNQIKTLSPLIIAKQGLLISQLFLKCMQKNQFQLKVYLNSQHAIDFRQRRHEIDLSTQLMNICQDSSQIFKDFKCMKLKLKTQLIAIQLFWEFNQRFKSNKLDKILQQNIQNQRNGLAQCQKDYLNQKYKLRGFTQFDYQIKQLKQQIKQILWVSASKRIIFMKAFPLCSNQYPIIKNLVRKKNNFRHQIERILNLSKQNRQNSSQRKIALSPNPSLRTKQSKISVIDPRISLDISTKYQILTKSKLIEEANARCSIMFVTADVRVKNNKTYFILQNQIMQQELVEINQELVSNIIMDNLLILVISGQNAAKAMQKIVNLSTNPPIIIALHSEIVQNIDELDYGHDFDSQHLIQLIKRENQIKLAELTYTKQFIKKISRTKIQNNEQVYNIHVLAYQKMNTQAPFKRVQAFIQMSKCKKNIHLQYNQGIYRDLSPGYEGNHNIDAKSYQNIISIKRWQKMLQFFKEICSSKVIKKLKNAQLNENTSKNIFLQIPAGKIQHEIISQNFATYINIYGQNGCGKTCFIKQIAKNLVQRQFYDFGVFLFEGKKIQKNFGGDFESYIKSQSQAGRLPVLEDFEKLLSQNTILIVDDFHLIRPRINARMKLFLDRLISKKVNLILVSLNELKLQNLPKMKKIKLQYLDSFETQILAYHIIDITNPKQIKQYNKLKQLSRKKNINFLIKDIFKIVDNTKKMKESQFKYNFQETTTVDNQQMTMKKSNTSIC